MSERSRLSIGASSTDNTQMMSSKAPTGQAVTLGEPHWYVTCRRNRFSEAPAVTAEYDNHVFPDVAALEARFAEEYPQ